MSEQTKFLLQESEMPTAWYNMQMDFATPLPPVIHPGTGKPIGPADLAPLFPMELIMQEVGGGSVCDAICGYSGRGARGVQVVASDAVDPGAAFGKGVGYARAHLFQV